jgi:protein ImuB
VLWLCIVSPIQEKKHALKALASWAGQFSSCVCLDAERWLLWLEIGSSLRYFGGLNPLLEKVTAGLNALALAATTGVAPTAEAAALLARQPQALPVLRLEQLQPAIAALPLNTLALLPAAIAGLQASGIASVGELLALPRDALARRWGLQMTGYLQRLLGERADPRKPYRVPHTYHRRFDFAEPVQTVEGLLFPLRRILYELQGYLRGRDTALQTLNVAFRHRGHADTVLTLRTTEPQRDALRLFALLREKLERTQLPGAVTRIRLNVEHFVALRDTQLHLWDESERHDASWSDLLDKLRARLGDQAVRRLGLRDDHRPEKAWCVESAAVAADLPPAFPDRPLWLLPPQPIERLPKLLGKPERIEAGWWSGEDSSRDYYIAQTAEGSRWWLYREAATARWFLQGIWA